MAKEKQLNIFNDEEGKTLFNTLETQLTSINEEIASAHKSIDKAEEKVMILEEARADLKKSIEIVRKHSGEFEEEKSPPDKLDEGLKEEVNEIDYTLTQLLMDYILANDPKSSIIKKMTKKRRADWINSCRLMREKDGRTPEEIEAMIEFSQKDSFWKSNILSMPKLREKFSQLWLKAEKNGYSGIKEWLDGKRKEEQHIKDPF